MTSMPQNLKPADFINEAAPGVERHDVAAINRRDRRELYAARQKVYPRLAHGRFRNIKWAVMAITLSVYYLLPWLRWDRGPNLPDQAVLLDFANGRLFLFFSKSGPRSSTTSQASW